MVWCGMVWYGMVWVVWYGKAKSKEDKIKLEPSVATGCVDGSTPMVWLYGMVKSGFGCILLSYTTSTFGADGPQPKHVSTPV